MGKHFDTYRPELYYMRGPGPKWHKKHEELPAHIAAVEPHGALMALWLAPAAAIALLGSWLRSL